MKLFIQNRKQQKVSVIVETPKNPKGLAFVMHGLGGFKEQPHIRAIAEAMLENSYTVVTFDTTNTIGESDGKYEDATITNYYADLEDVITWSKTQPFFREPFILAGHSLGGICTALFAEEFPSRVKALAPISTVVSGKLSFMVEPKEALEGWERTGWQEKPSSSKPGLIKRLRWSHMIDRLKYDVLPNANTIKIPVLLIVGEKDDRHFSDQKILFQRLSGPKELHVIKGAPHTFKEPTHLKELNTIFSNWLRNL